MGYANMDKWGALYLHGRFPLHDAHELFPVGAPLAAMTGWNRLEMLVSAPLRWVLPFPLWFNLAHLAWIPLNAIAFTVLAARLWDSPWVRVSAAVTWAISPVFLGEIAAGRLTQVALIGLPLAVRGLVDASEGRFRWPGAVGLALVGLGYWYYAIFLGIVAVLFLRRAALRPLVLLGVSALLLVAPALAIVAYSAVSAGIDATGGLDPSKLSPEFDNALQLARAQPRQLEGWFPLALAPGLVLALRRDRRWLVVAAVCLAFALGPGQRLGDRLWLLPYWLLWQGVPMLGRLTYPSRWVDFGMIFLVVASFAGLARLAWGRRLAPLVPVGVFLQLAPLPSFALAPSGVWEAVGRSSGALITLPLLHAPELCRWQFFHGRPVIGGMAEGLPWAWPPAFRGYVEANGLLMQLVALGDGNDLALDVRAGDVAPLRADGFTQIALDTDAWRRWRRGANVPIRERLTALGVPVYDGSDGALWDLPADAPPGAAAVPLGTRLPPP